MLAIAYAAEPSTDRRLAACEALLERCRDALLRMDPDQPEHHAAPFMTEEYDRLLADLFDLVGDVRDGAR